MSDKKADPGRAPPAGEARTGRHKNRPSIWVSTTYFAEGFPYSIVNTLAEVMFKEFGASLQAIGMTSLFHLPWNIKFLWGPLLDGFATRRGWLIGLEVPIALVLVLMALAAPLGASLTLISVLFVALAFLSATHDIAIDGYYLAALDKKEQSEYVGLRAFAYRMAMWAISAGALLILPTVGWAGVYFACAAVVGLLCVFHALVLPRAEVARRPLSALGTWLDARRLGFAALAFLAFLLLRALYSSAPVQEFITTLHARIPALAKVSTSAWIAIVLLLVLTLLLANLGRIRNALREKDSFYLSAFVDFLDQDRVGFILAFVVFFRAGESFVLKMRYAFLRDIGMTPEQFGLAAGTVGLWASIGATMVGGWLIAKRGLRPWIWPFVISQNVLNLLYMVLALWHDARARAGGGPVPEWALFGVVGTEAFGAGLGTAVFMVYLMRCCRPAYKAAHMAILTALMSLSFTFAGVLSGFLADALGFSVYFGFSFLASVPAMALIPFIPHLDEDFEAKR